MEHANILVADNQLQRFHCIKPEFISVVVFCQMAQG